MWEGLGISAGPGLIILITLYYVIKWAVKNGINESVLNSPVKSNKHYNNQDMI